MNMDKNEKHIYNKLVDYCPELKYKGKPKDREFFFNILNTVKPGIVDRLVFNSVKKRQ